MSVDATHSGPALPPWSLSAAGRNSDPAPARAELPGDTDFGEDVGYMFGEDGLSFTDVLDIINPLQHLPVVSTLYRALTGDTITPGARMVGGAIFGGPTGFAAAVFNNAMVDHTGKDAGDTVLAALLPDAEAPDDATVALAAGEDDDAAGARDEDDARSVAMAPPAGLIAASNTERIEEPLLPVTGQSPLLTAARTEPLVDRSPRPQPFAAGRAAPLNTAETDPKPTPTQPTQLAALPQASAKPEPARPAETARPEKAKPRPEFSPTPLDPSLIPEAMLSALEKYEQMKRGS